jgi:hypothetical protein
VQDFRSKTAAVQFANFGDGGGPSKRSPDMLSRAAISSVAAILCRSTRAARLRVARRN